MLCKTTDCLNETSMSKIYCQDCLSKKKHLTPQGMSSTDDNLRTFITHQIDKVNLRTEDKVDAIMRAVEAQSNDICDAPHGTGLCTTHQMPQSTPPTTNNAHTDDELAELRDHIAKFADMPTRQKEYKIIQLIQSHKEQWQLEREVEVLRRLRDIADQPFGNVKQTIYVDLDAAEQQQKELR